MQSIEEIKLKREEVEQQLEELTELENQIYRKAFEGLVGKCFEIYEGRFEKFVKINKVDGDVCRFYSVVCENIGGKFTVYSMQNSDVGYEYISEYKEITEEEFVNKAKGFIEFKTRQLIAS